MDIWVAFDNLESFLSRFTQWFFYDFVSFFTADNEGIMIFWPFFIAFVIFIAFIIIRGIVNLISEL